MYSSLLVVIVFYLVACWQNFISFANSFPCIGEIRFFRMVPADEETSDLLDLLDGDVDWNTDVEALGNGEHSGSILDHDSPGNTPF